MAEPILPESAELDTAWLRVDRPFGHDFIDPTVPALLEIAAVPNMPLVVMRVKTLNLDVMLSCSPADALAYGQQMQRAGQKALAAANMARLSQARMHEQIKGRIPGAEGAVDLLEMRP